MDDKQRQALEAYSRGEMTALELCAGVSAA